MESNPTYRVEFTGEFVQGVEPLNAISAFAEMAKISPDQAKAALAQPRVLKSALALDKAHGYRDRLTAIGLGVALKAEAPVTAALALSLEPIEDRHGQDAPAVAAAPAAPALPPGEMSCPKCGERQAKAAQCRACGVFVHKVQPVAAPAAVTVEEDTHDDEPADPSMLSVMAMVAAAGAGAYAWLMVAVTFELEMGLVAWAVGGAVGFAALLSGSAGPRTGVLCGVLALAAILGGKYLIVDHDYQQFAQAMTAELPGGTFTEAYDTFTEMAREYVDEVHTDEELRDFMVKHELTEHTDPDAISRNELEQFRREDDPMLRESLEALEGQNVGAELDALVAGGMNSLTGLSHWEIIADSLGPLDYLFFFFGVATAFRLGSTGRIG